MNNGIICKDKGIEKYALENYGRLSGMTTIGIIVTALTEYQPLPEQESKELINVDWDGLCINLNTYMRKKDNDLTIDFLKELFEGYVGYAQSHPEAREMPSDEEIEKKKRALKLQKEQLGYGIKEVMHFMDGFNIAIKWMRERIKSQLK